MRTNGQGAIKAPFKKACTEKTIAQGAIEYLLILAAAIIVVAIVISFMSSTVDHGKDAGDDQTLNYFCNVIDQNSADCACYTNNGNGYFPTSTGDTIGNYCCVTTTNALLKTKYESFGNTC